MVDYSDRLKAAMTHGRRPGMTLQQLADGIGVSYQGVKKVIDGKSTAFTAENNSKAARVLGVDTDWLATGEGDMLPSAGRHSAQEAQVAYPLNITTLPTPTLSQALGLLARAIADSPNRGSKALTGTLASLGEDPGNPVYQQVLEALLAKPTNQTATTQAA